MRVPALLLALVAVVALTVAGCGRTTAKKSDVLARVNNQPITKSQFDDALEKSEIAAKTLDSLIIRELIREEAKKRSIEVSKADLDRRIAWLKDDVLAATGKDFSAWMADTGQTDESVRADTSFQILAAKLVLTDSERKKYFEDNKAVLKDGPRNNESVIYREVIVTSQQEAAAVRKELESQAANGRITGEKFGKIAQQRTIDPNGRSRGGMTGWAVKGKTGDPKLDEVLFKLQPGEISEPITVPPPPPPKGQKQPATQQQPTFYRVIMVEKRLKASPFTLEGNEDVVERMMLSDQRYQPQLAEFFSSMRANADVQISDPRFRALEDAYRQSREARQQLRSQPGGMAPPVPQPSGQAPPSGGK